MLGSKGIDLSLMAYLQFVEPYGVDGSSRMLVPTRLRVCSLVEPTLVRLTFTGTSLVPTGTRTTRVFDGTSPKWSWYAEEFGWREIAVGRADYLHTYRQTPL